MENLMNILFITLSQLLLGCSTESEVPNTNQEEATIGVEEEAGEESNESGIVFSPDLVFFYSTAIITDQTNLDCFLTSDGDYCGLFRYMLVNSDEWEGTDDMAHACHVVHNIHPDFVLSNGLESEFGELTILLGVLDSFHFDVPRVRS